LPGRGIRIGDEERSLRLWRMRLQSHDAETRMPASYIRETAPSRVSNNKERTVGTAVRDAANGRGMLAQNGLLAAFEVNSATRVNAHVLN
jgi:hypothetical protein